MTQRVLILGGYGNFGSFIAKSLSAEPGIKLIIAGRSAEKAQNFAASLNAEWAAMDIHQNLDQSLAQIRPDIVIHTSGPFQRQSYDVAETCIRHGCHYIDLADAREFVANVGMLDITARAAKVLVVSGASSVPCLTAAVIDEYQTQFHALESVDYAIATAQQTNRGLATTRAVLSYAGKPFTTLINGVMKTVYGWQNLHFHHFPGLGWRPLGNCNVPDLALFPARYPNLKTIRFYAGLEVPFEHIGLWLLSWLARLGIIPPLDKFASLLLNFSRLFDSLGSDRSGFYMKLSGQDADNQSKSITFNLTAKDGFGPYIPCMPAILLARKLIHGDITTRGAQPCLGLITLADYLDGLAPYPITWHLSA